MASRRSVLDNTFVRGCTGHRTDLEFRNSGQWRNEHPSDNVQAESRAALRDMAGHRRIDLLIAGLRYSTSVYINVYMSIIYTSA